MRQRDLPSSLLLRLNFVTVHRRMCRLILDGCDDMAVALPSSLHIIEEHQHRSWKERQSASPATNLAGTGLCDCIYHGVLPSILAGCDDSSIVIACHQGASTSLKEDEAKGSAKQSTAAVELCASQNRKRLVLNLNDTP
jgi:hypothetical protein